LGFDQTTIYRSLLVDRILKWTKGLLGFFHFNHNNQSLKEALKALMQCTPSPPKALGLQTCFQITLHFAPLHVPSLAQSQARRRRSNSFRTHTGISLIVIRYTDNEERTELSISRQPAKLIIRTFQVARYLSTLSSSRLPINLSDFFNREGHPK
jgi:hypothetical protein